MPTKNNSLDKMLILHFLSKFKLHLPVDTLHVFEAIDSTNCFLKSLTLPKDTGIVACCAETQTAGRGRLGRQWISLPGENVYFSLRYPLPRQMPNLASLSLVAGLATLSALKKITQLFSNNVSKTQIQLKWPNDLFWDNKKLGGILVELIGSTEANPAVVIGIGLNVSLSKKDEKTPAITPQKPWSSLDEFTSGPFNRNEFIAYLIYTLDHTIDRFKEQGFLSFLPEWTSVDYLNARKISVLGPNGQIDGIACGVNAQGQLLVKDNQGTFHALSSGEASLQLPI
ncbi:MAG: biotin--[acetyl-CoA-carboxylase] ligase [Legionella sp.]|nr:biotin--[acetyl-CoA-carboxylase] ligase [Legionella sp.]